jgi:hypothetical protein
MVGRLMAATYEFRLSSPFGTPLQVIPHEAIETLAYTTTVNSVGALTATLARDAIDDAYMVPDARIEVWRTPDGGAARREADGPWLLQADAVGLDSRGKRYRKIKAVTANAILGFRRVLYYANDTTYTLRSAVPADNLMKSVVTQNMGSTADSSPLVSPLAAWPTRLWTAYLSVDADVSLGPNVTKAFAWQSVLTTLQELARDAAEQETPVYFDVVAGTSTLLAFRTWVNVRGVDRSSGAARLVISPERGSLGGTVERTTDWANMATAVVAGGQGQDAARSLGAAYDSARIALSPFGLREHFLNATQMSSSTALAGEASAELRARRPKKALTGTLISVPGAVYGLDWGFGDKIVAEFERDSFTARVDSVTVEMKGGLETVSAAIRGED